MTTTDLERASWLNEKGRSLLDRGDLERAEAAFMAAVDADPSFHFAWFNLGLVYKRRHDWQRMLECNERAVDIDAEREDPAWWNLGIAATALREWDKARKAWSAYGIPIPEGTGPVEGEFEAALVRLNPDKLSFQGDMEVVWCRRIDPTRAVILNVPLPKSLHRCGDIVLHDGEQRGERVIDGERYRVFDELDRWEPSEDPTLSVSIRPGSGEDTDQLIAVIEARGMAGEDWTRNIRSLCKACSEGSIDEHAHPTPQGWEEWRDLGIAGNLFEAKAVLDRWIADASTSHEYANLRVAF